MSRSVVMKSSLHDFTVGETILTSTIREQAHGVDDQGCIGLYTIRRLECGRNEFAVGDHWDQFEVHVVGGRNIARAMEAVTSKDRRLRPFLRRHHAELELFIGHGRIDWTPVRLLVQELDLHDASGKVPTKSAIARAWRAVGLEVEKEARNRSKPIPAGDLAVGVRLALDQPADASVRAARSAAAHQPQASAVALPIAAVASAEADRTPAHISGVSEPPGISEAMRRAIERVTSRSVPRPIDT